MRKEPPRRRGTHRRRKPLGTVYAGLTTCLRCDQVFESWDRRQNRLCDPCRYTIEEQPSDEPSYPLHTPRRPRGADPS
jgi:hypothetical protein